MILNSEFEKHRFAIKHVRSPLCDQMKPPHAFIDNCKAGKTDFKGTFKKRRPMSTILTRKMKNIDQLLHQKSEFEEVRQTLRRVREIKSGKSKQFNIGCDPALPKTYHLSFTLTKNRRPNAHAMVEHVAEMASLMKRIAELGNVSLKLFVKVIEEQ
jgi:hypothetical protein